MERARKEPVFCFEDERAKGEASKKKRRKVFLRRFIYYARTRGKSQINENLMKDEELRLDFLFHFDYSSVFRYAFSAGFCRIGWGNIRQNERRPETLNTTRGGEAVSGHEGRA